MNNSAISDCLNEEQGQILVELARATICDNLQCPVQPAKDAGLQEALSSPVFARKRGVFVTLHKKGQLRGCIGTLVGRESIADGIRDNALNAAFHDYRFKPLTVEEIDDLEVEISILTEPVLLEYKGEEELKTVLRPGIDGVIIRQGGASATFLPQVWKQLPEVENFLNHLCLKAGLPADEWRRENIKVGTYQVQHFSEKK